MPHFNLTFTLTFTFATALLVAAADAAPPTIEVLGNGRMAFFTSGLSADGRHVVGSYRAHPATWSRGTGFVELSQATGSANACSADGRIITGDYQSPQLQTRPFRWEASTGFETLSMGENRRPEAWAAGMAISADGLVIGGAVYLSGREVAPAIWNTPWTTPDSFTSLLANPQNGNGVYGISENGQVVVGTSTALTGSSRATRWTASGSMEDLGVLRGAQSYALAVSGDGEVVAGYSRAGATVSHAFRWTSATGMVDLGTLGGPNSRANAMSGDGSVLAGSASIPNGATHAFLWTARDGMRDLRELLSDLGTDINLWNLTRVDGVSADGKVLVGRGVYNGVETSWIVNFRCPADLDASGLVDFADYADFVTAFETGDREFGDFNADGFVDFFDYLDFVQAFETGC